MANKIDITIKAKDEASGVIDDINDSFGGLGEGAEEAEKVTSDAFGDMFDNAMDAFVGINQGIELVMKAFDALKLAYEGTVGKVLEIAGEVEEFVRVSGDAPENMSALRLEAEKADVPFDDLYKAMENLNKNGVPPTLDNLVAIADEYTKLEDPIDRARFLTEEFGSAGDDIAPMLDAIADGVTAVQDAGLIFTEDELQDIRDYEEAVANLGLAWDGIVTTIGMAVIPSLTEFFELLKRDFETFGLMGQYVSALNQGFKDGNKDVFDYAAGLINLAKVDLNSAESVKWLKDEVDELNKSTDDSIPTLEEYRAQQNMLEVTGTNTRKVLEGMTAEVYNGEIAMKNAGEAAGGAAGWVAELAEAAMAAALEQAKLRAELDNITSIDANYKGIIDLAYEYTDILEEITEQQRIMAEEPIGSEKYDEAKGKLEDLQGTMTELANQVTLDMFQATIAVGGVTEAELAAYFQMAIDMGLMSEKGAQAAMDAYGDAIETINGYKIDDKTGNVIIDAAEAYATLVMIQQMQIADKTGNIDIFVRYHGTTPSGGYDPYENYTGPGVAAGGAIHAAASGLAASLSSYWVGERGPEPFFPAMDGRIVSNTQAMAALRGGAGINAREIANAVRDGVREAMRDERGGNVYNLTMPTSSNPADVRTAFELMEAWGA